jgi:hypothetical protein
VADLNDVEIAILEHVDWFNNRRLHTELGDIPPTEHEAAHSRKITPVTTPETAEASTEPGAGSVPPSRPGAGRTSTRNSSR